MLVDDREGFGGDEVSTLIFGTWIVMEFKNIIVKEFDTCTVSMAHCARNLNIISGGVWKSESTDLEAMRY